MSFDTKDNPYGFTPSDFAPPEQIILSPEALAEARKFVQELGQFEKESEWIAAFTWCYERTFQRNTDSRSVDEGPGIDLAGYRTSEVPASVVEVRDGVPVVFIIPSARLESAKKKEIVETRLQSGRLSYMLV